MNLDKELESNVAASANRANEVMDWYYEHFSNVTGKDVLTLLMVASQMYANANGSPDKVLFMHMANAVIDTALSDNAAN